jgi:hypothetical protein
MDTESITLQKVLLDLNRLRENPKTRNRFPLSLWEKISQLTESYPIEEVSRVLGIQLPYLKQKTKQLMAPKGNMDFVEVRPSPPLDLIQIELTTTAGVQVKIRGPVSSISALLPLFED